MQSPLVTDGELLCPQCGYDLRGATTNTIRCPECGNQTTASAAIGSYLKGLKEAVHFTVAAGGGLLLCVPLFLFGFSPLLLLDAVLGVAIWLVGLRQTAVRCRMVRGWIVTFLWIQLAAVFAVSIGLLLGAGLLYLSSVLTDSARGILRALIPPGTVLVGFPVVFSPILLLSRLARGAYVRRYRLC